MSISVIAKLRLVLHFLHMLSTFWPFISAVHRSHMRSFASFHFMRHDLQNMFISKSSVSSDPHDTQFIFSVSGIVLLSTRIKRLRKTRGSNLRIPIIHPPYLLIASLIKKNLIIGPCEKKISAICGGSFF